MYLASVNDNFAMVQQQDNNIVKICVVNQDEDISVKVVHSETE